MHYWHHNSFHPLSLSHFCRQFPYTFARAAGSTQPSFVGPWLRRDYSAARLADSSGKAAAVASSFAWDVHSGCAAYATESERSACLVPLRHPVPVHFFRGDVHKPIHVNAAHWLRETHSPGRSEDFVNQICYQTAKETKSHPQR